MKYWRNKNIKIFRNCMKRLQGKTRDMRSKVDAIPRSLPLQTSPVMAAECLAVNFGRRRESPGRRWRVAYLHSRSCQTSQNSKCIKTFSLSTFGDGGSECDVMIFLDISRDDLHIPSNWKVYVTAPSEDPECPDGYC